MILIVISNVCWHLVHVIHWQNVWQSFANELANPDEGDSRKSLVGSIALGNSARSGKILQPFTTSRSNYWDHTMGSQGN
jgi:hypothetical protein